MSPERGGTGLGLASLWSAPELASRSPVGPPCQSTHSNCCVIVELPIAGFDHGLCQRLYCFAWMSPEARLQMAVALVGVIEQ